ncbi:glomulin [Colletes gigas]|uniref:glomulin n=1 Tax=Colletes gigas TaxID=935657 RepID=UPI001C9ADAB8|nr:glomulin [Colletes gigas]
MSQSQENLTKKFINELTDHLKENKIKETLDLFDGDNYDNIIKETSWEIVQIASSYLTVENAKDNGELIDCCKIILNAIAEKCNPCETVLEFLEQVDRPEDDMKFCIILKVLGKSLSKMNDKTKSIEWCIITIRSYVESLPVPLNEFEDSTVIKIKFQNIYIAIISFLEPLVEEAALENDNSENYAILRDYLLSILIFLMGNPLCYVPEEVLESNIQYHLPEKIIMLMNRISEDLLWFLNVVNARSKGSNSKKKNINEECCNLKIMLFESNESVPDLAYANFYFYIVTKSHLWEKVPQVYSLRYIFQECLYLVIKLLEEQENVTMRKGLNLMDQLLQKITKHSLISKLLELNVYTKLINVIVKVMIYCDNIEERKKAVQIFHKYIELFNIEARYYVVLHLYQTSEHSGLVSVTTGILKACIIECLEATPPLPYFLGKKLESLLKLACKLQHGSASDLVELSDEIITSLNLLRFLLLRDRCNQTGIWNLVNKLEDDYLKPLRKGISLCKSHWKVKIKDLEEQSKIHKISDNVSLENNDAEITLTVGGEKLPAMPVSEKISFCYQAINGLDVMESILIRVNECISDSPDNVVTSK